LLKKSLAPKSVIRSVESIAIIIRTAQDTTTVDACPVEIRNQEKEKQKGRIGHDRIKVARDKWTKWHTLFQ
jgi:hypothetical protein